jgi:hypothetical protein
MRRIRQLYSGLLRVSSGRFYELSWLASQIAQIGDRGKGLPVKKGKVALELNKHHAMKTHGEVEVRLHHSKLGTR